MLRQNTQKATSQLQNMQSHTHLFGPEDYGNYAKKDGLKRKQTNVVVVQDKSGGSQLISQTIYGNSGENKRIMMKQQEFGQQPNTGLQYKPGLRGRTASFSSGTTSSANSGGNATVRGRSASLRGTPDTSHVGANGEMLLNTPHQTTNHQTTNHQTTLQRRNSVTTTIPTPTNHNTPARTKRAQSTTR